MAYINLQIFMAFNHLSILDWIIICCFRFQVVIFDGNTRNSSSFILGYYRHGWFLPVILMLCNYLYLKGYELEN